VSKRAEIHIRKLGFLIARMVSIGASAETLTGMVVGVADGDTITVLDANREQHKIRLSEQGQHSRWQTACI
jgi:endonuclease YncB( thermonuclease family)